jgi:integrase
VTDGLGRTRKGNLESWIATGPNARGYWTAMVWMGTKGNGKPDRRFVQRNTLASVKKRVRELERNRDAGKVTKTGKVPTVQQMMERHLTVILPSRNRAPRTIDDYWSKCRNDIFPRWGAQRIDRLLPEHIEDGLAEMLAAGHAPSHVRKVHAILSAAYEVQVGRENVARNPCRQVEAPSAGEGDKESLSQTESRAVVAAATERANAARWSIGLACGLRQGEALGLRWQYVDLARRQMLIRWQLQRLKWQHGCKDPRSCAKPHCKAKACPKKCKAHARACPPLCPAGCTEHARLCPERKGGGLVFREIKEKRRKRVKLPPELVTVLKAHHDAQVLQRLTADTEWDEHDLVFCQWNGKPIDPRRDWEEWGEILAAAGLPHHRLHAMRHSAASIALDQGIALAVVQEMLGHSDIRVTRGYTHVSDPLHEDAADRMGSALFGGTAITTAITEPDE